jgi:adenylate cyclase
LLPDELKAITTRSTKSAEAYDCYLHARATLQVDWSNKAMLRSARRLFERATEIDGEYAEAFAGMADCDAFLWIAGDLDVSYQDIFANSSKALNLAPNLAEAQASNGLALYLGGDPTEAIKAFERAIALNPDLWAANTLYGYSCRATGRFEKAALYYERAAKLKSDDWDSLAMLADVYESLGRHDLSNSAARRALARYESVLGQRPNNADGIAVGAAMLVLLGEKAKAVEWAKRAIVLDPESYSVRYNVACVHAVGGNPDAALECLEYIYSEVPRARRWLLGTVKHDAQLKSLRDRSDFQALVSRLEAAAAEQS